MPDRIIRAQTDKPAEQQVVLQLFGRDRWPAFCGVELTEGGVETIEGLICQFPDPPQRMAGRDPLLNRHVGEQGAAALLLTSHLNWATTPFSRGTGFSATS